jgi:WD40 repeat protein
MFVLSHKSTPVDRVIFAPTGPLLAASQGGWYGVWNCSDRQLVGEHRRYWSYAHPGIRFHPTLPRVYGGNEFDDVEWFDPVANESDTLCQGTGWVEESVLTRDGNRLLVCERGYCEFRLFDLTRDRGRLGTMLWSTRVYSSLVWGVQVFLELFPDEERFIVAESHGNTRTRLAIRSLETGELLRKVQLPNTEVSGLALSPDGTLAVVVSARSLFAYDTNRLKTAPRRVLNDNKKHFTGIAFHPSGRFLAATSNDETVKLYDTATWEVAKSFTWAIGRMSCVAFNPDGTLAAAGSEDGNVVVWDVDV